MRFPRTLSGWRKLFWIALRRCMRCRGPLCEDWAPYDDGVTLWCLSCGGIPHPRGFFRALRWNAQGKGAQQR